MIWRQFLTGHFILVHSTCPVRQQSWASWATDERQSRSCWNLLPSREPLLKTVSHPRRGRITFSRYLAYTGVQLTKTRTHPLVIYQYASAAVKIHLHYFWMLVWTFFRRQMRACEARTKSVCRIFLINWYLKYIFFLQAFDILKEAASLSDAVLHDVQSVSTLSEVCCLFLLSPTGVQLQIISSSFGYVAFLVLLKVIVP